MGKYIQKAKAGGEVAVMELVGASLVGGVRTRARTLALQRLQKSIAASSPPDAGERNESSKSYLELRSRRLEKSFVSSPKKSAAKRAEAEKKAATATTEVEVSFGENVLEAEARDARETTPCSLIRDPERSQTPGSTTKPTSSATSNRRTQISRHQNPNIPSAREMEEFFAGAEQQQHRLFTEKYNFDPVNDCPLPGRYIWVKLDS